MIVQLLNTLYFKKINNFVWHFLAIFVDYCIGVIVRPILACIYKKKKKNALKIQFLITRIFNSL